MSEVSYASDEPPPAAGVSTPANQHPLWVKAAQAASGHGRAIGSGNTGSAGNTKFMPISMVDLELKGRNELDGASTVASVTGAFSSTQNNTRARLESDDEEPNPANVAFGKQKKKQVENNESDDDEVSSVASSKVREANKRIFPIDDLQCVGCALGSRLQPVDDFVRNSYSSMGEMALWKMAALTYKTRVCEPAQAEGINTPPWNWKDVRLHYTLHKIDSKLQRLENLRILAAMRRTLELRLMKQDDEGETSLDRANSDQLLKIVAMQSREICLLNEGGATSVVTSTHATKRKR